MRDKLYFILRESAIAGLGADAAYDATDWAAAAIRVED